MPIIPLSRVIFQLKKIIKIKFQKLKIKIIIIKKKLFYFLFF